MVGELSGGIGQRTAQDLLGYAKELTLTGDLAKAKPQTLRYRLLHQAGRLARSGRRTRVATIDLAKRRLRDWERRGRE